MPFGLKRRFGSTATSVWKPKLLRRVGYGAFVLVLWYNQQAIIRQHGLLDDKPTIPPHSELAMTRPFPPRSERFPSVQERVKLYMGNWYLPPCAPQSRNGTRRPSYMSYTVQTDSHGFPYITFPEVPQLTVESNIRPDNLFLVTRTIIEECARPFSMLGSIARYAAAVLGLNPPKRPLEDRVIAKRNMDKYCVDTLDMLDMHDSAKESYPILSQFGDGAASGETGLPIFSKFRETTTQESLQQVTGQGSSSLACVTEPRLPLLGVHSGPGGVSALSPILWKLGTHRHWRLLPLVYQNDIPWYKKKNEAIWRGAMTGPHAFPRNDSDYETCRNNPRCWFVYNTNRNAKKSHLINAGLSSDLGHLGQEKTVNEIVVVKGSVRMWKFLTYKMIISFQGNDVSSGLKWNLLSNSVVIMPPPTKTSWAMEDLLEPWVHYIPMDADGSNAADRVQWVIDNDDTARTIAERSTLFMYDIAFHPSAAREEREIKEEIMRRYQALWR